MNKSFARYLSVHVLGQFVFCPRSAVLAFELGDETDVDEPAPRLDYLPNYDFRLIAEEWSKRILWLRRVLLLLAITLLCLMAGAFFRNRALFYPAMTTFICSLIWLSRTIPVLWTLHRRMRAAMHACAREPTLDLRQIEGVSWWDMRKAGFEPRSYSDPFRHTKAPLEGNPWRVLERGSLRIPVIRSGGRKLGPARGTVYDKHRIRLAAYALLLEATPHTECPYGIILSRDDHKGLAVPLDSGVRSHVARLLVMLHVTLQQSQAGVAQPQIPPQRSRCATCRHGAPIPIDEREVWCLTKRGTPLLLLQHSSGRLFHCACGDRFGSAPPHQKSVRNMLIARV